MFEKYDPLVIEAVVDARNRHALQNVHKEWPPTVGQVTAACEEEAERRERIRIAAASARKPIHHEYTPAPKFPGCRARLKIHPDAPQFATAKTWAESGAADPCDWRWDDDGSIWVAFNWHIAATDAARSTWKSPTDAELRAYYGQKEAEWQRKDGDGVGDAPAAEGASS